MVNVKWEEVALPFEGNELLCQLTKYHWTISSVNSQCQLKVAVLTLLSNHVNNHVTLITYSQFIIYSLLFVFEGSLQQQNTSTTQKTS